MRARKVKRLEEIQIFFKEPGAILKEMSNVQT